MTLGAVEVARLLGRPEPTPEQVAVIEAPLEPLLVVAGAGSGKTETMTARVVHLVANGLVERDRVLGLTFTRKAAGELSDRVRRRLRALDRAVGRAVSPTDALVAPTISTYNAYAAGIVGEHALRIGVEPSARLLGEAARWQLAHEIVERWAVDLDVDLAPSTVTEAVLDLAGALAEHLLAPEEVQGFADSWVAALDALPAGSSRGMPKALRDVRASIRLRARLMDLVGEFTARKRAADVMDFADQVALAARLARDVPEVGAAERSRFAVVLLDEYQDTSVAQLVLLRHLFGDLAGPGVGHPVTAVGDPHQSIYGWRGASAGGLERFPGQFPGADGDLARVVALSTSWRNDRAVLAAANVVADPLRRDVAARAHLALEPLGARPGAEPGEVAVAVTETAEEEAAEVAAFVAARRAPGVTAAVLCRRRAQFPVLHQALLDAGLPVEVVGLGGLLDTPEVVDLVAALEAAHDPSRGDSLMRLLTGPRARLGLADLHALADWSAQLARAHAAGDATAHDRSIVDALDELPPPGWVSGHGRRLSPTGRERLADLAGVLRRLRGLTYLSVADLAGEAERLLGLDIEVEVRGGSAVPRAHLDAFRAVAAEFDAAEGGTLGAFLAWLSAAQQEERGLEVPVTEPDADAVQLLTVHAAKGLEWDVVAVPGLVERTFPVTVRAGWVTDRGAVPTALRGDRDHLPDMTLAGATDLSDVSARLADYAAAHAAHHLAEERRLAYVAVTRARRHLLLAASRWREGVRPTPPSVFLDEVVAAGDRGEVPLARIAWAPPVDTAGGVPERPQPAAGPPALWPAERPFGARTDPLERAAAAVHHAMDRARDHARDHALGLAPGAAAPDPVPAAEARRSGRPTRDAGDDGHELLAVAELLLAERRRREADRSDVRLPAHLAASAVVQLAADPTRFTRQLRRPVPLEPSSRARRGTAFHAWVEGYFGAAALMDVEALPGADDDAVPDDPDLHALQARFLASEWAARTPVAVEVDVETPVGDVILRSRIDAVFPEPGGGVVVVDWKTGRPPVDEEAVRARELQLATYRLAWSRRSGLSLDRVSAAFYYVSTGETVRPDGRLDAARIEQTLAAAVAQTG